MKSFESQLSSRTEASSVEETPFKEESEIVSPESSREVPSAEPAGLQSVRERLGLVKEDVLAAPALEGSESLESAPKSPYDFESLSPALQEAVLERTERILKTLPPASWSASHLFKLKSGILDFGVLPPTPEQTSYFDAYSRLAVRQLVLGEFFGEEEPIQEEAEVLRELRERSFNDAASRQYEGAHMGSSFASGIDVLHDITHTWVDAAQSGDPGETFNMIPKFLRYKRTLKERPQLHAASAHDESVVALYNTESFWSRRNVLKSIRKAKSREDFIRRDYRTTPLTDTDPTPFTQYVRGRVYDEYASNPNLLYEIFVESSAPLMEKYAPEEAEAFRKAKEGE